MIGLNCLSSINRNTGAGTGRSSCGLTQGDQDITIQRSYTKTDDTERERVATITSKIGLPRTVITLESRFGAAVVARFVAAPGIGLTATYDEARAANEIVIAPMRPLPAADDQAQYHWRSVTPLSNLLREDAVPVVDQESIRMVARMRLPEPLRPWLAAGHDDHFATRIYARRRPPARPHRGHRHKPF